MTDIEAFTGGNVVVRPRGESDIPQAAAGLVKVHSTDGYPVEGVSQPEAWLTPPGMLNAWVAEISGSIVGHVAVSSPTGEDAVSMWLDLSHESEDKVGVLARLFVVREARRRAVGESLVLAVMDYARSDGIRLVLDVMVKDSSAIRLYERLGWIRLGTAIHAFGDDQQTEAICYVSPDPQTSVDRG
ncbi:GNAT family N-acetyltransferase [Streptacidiphilus sp. N1-10]|uniref:GNAT family N-acetyltransferase n=1 Tax=Streptacidiphilus jeojiensis TaxID=3229225 RepID=A0ABV6XNE2_9ACTN